MPSASVSADASFTICCALRDSSADGAAAIAVTDAHKAALRANVEEAVALGIFGAPSFVAGDEMFWGDDRLEDALDWAAMPPASKG